MDIREDIKEISLKIVGELVGVFINDELICLARMKNKSFQHESIVEIISIEIKGN